nr:acetyl-/propionyl-CoA carboxylase subunit alpha [Nocardioidaceae bacterium]
TVIPFHRAVLDDPAYVAADGDFAVHTRWIETEWDNTVEPYASGPGASESEQRGEREAVTVEVGGKRIEVVLPAGLGAGGAAASTAKKAKRRAASADSDTSAGGEALTSPMQGTIVKVAVANGDQVAAGDPVVVLEAMKMEQPLHAHKAGTVTGLKAEPGAGVSAGEIICTIADG